MRQWLERHWRSPRRWHLANVLLVPLSWLYGAVVALRRGLYRLGLKRRTRLARPVVVVGNVVAGGAGKTPVTIALVHALQQRGLRVGVLARGYGRRSRGVRAVHADASASEVGDEPLLIHHATGAPVYVASRRAQAGQALLRAHPETDLLVCDDGLQHLALVHDYALCVMPAWGIGNGRLLPAGPLRERWPRPVDAVLASADAPPVASAPGAAPVLAMQRHLAGHAVDAAGQRHALAHIAQAPVIIAVAGIAQPEAFFAMLEHAGLRLQARVALPDHHDFGQLPPALQALPPGAVVLCTEKDAVKLWRLLPNALAVPLQVTLPQALIEAIARLAPPARLP
ncbi:hypothetical protein AAV94_09680 [Lampropedia cohaerens]|uniref:Tetraacyldisaccharide 4'-kinase n=1 Tax=Lampropedia cohaerens TaxID=1610491 RepID=A0A0U1PYK0_9BURK|nr:tetraacyldisaccharide 4'-kinase [Lampropedia cohaerens]KKW67592.1 hypothetical protein AAV94_09680 [Lampropedia cohaerens]